MQNFNDAVRTFVCATQAWGAFLHLEFTDPTAFDATDAVLKAGGLETQTQPSSVGVVGVARRNWVGRDVFRNSSYDQQWGLLNHIGPLPLLAFVGNKLVDASASFYEPAARMPRTPVDFTTGAPRH